jgi:integrase
MAEHLTEKLVKNLPAPAKGNKLTYDDEVKGFAIRVTAAGAKAFVVNYYVAGRERRYTIGAHPDWTVTAARSRAKELKQEVDRGEDPLGKRIEDREAPTVGDLFDAYKEKHIPTKRDRSASDDISMWETYILPKFRATKLADLTSEDIDDLHRSIGATYKIRANRTIEVLSTALNLAVRWEWVTKNVAAGVKVYPEEQRRRYAAPAELTRVLQAMADHSNQDSCDVLRLIILTGARKGEVFRALWENIDLEDGIWIKPSAHTKQKREHRVPLSGAATELLRRRRETIKDSPWVFPGRKGADDHITDIKKTWEACREAATITLWREKPDAAALINTLQVATGRVPTVEEIQTAATVRKVTLPTGSLDLRIHDLRHTYASMLASKNTSLVVIGALLGHTQTQTTSRYAHLFDDPLRAATEVAATTVNGINGKGA